VGLVAQTDAIAVRIITVVTLFYLPATFVSVRAKHLLLSQYVR
jgi:hypothetical protein